RRRKSDRLVADGGLLLRLPFRGPLDWEAMLSYFAARAIAGIEQVEGTTYRRTIVIGADPGVLELLPGGEGELLLRAHLPHWEEVVHVVHRSRRIAGLDFDLEHSTESLSKEQIIAPLLQARPGLRPPGTWDPFETGVRAIIGQQVTVAGANTITGRLVERLGTPVSGLDRLGLTHTFPSAASVADANLTGLGLTPARAVAIRGFARAVAEDAVRLDRSIDLEHFVDSSTPLDGLRPWTAHYLALRRGEPDAYPATDLGLRRAFGRHAPDPGLALAELAEGWRPWRALATTHLWFAHASRPEAVRGAA